MRELEKELRLSLLALGAVTGTGESPASSWVADDSNGNTNGLVGGSENKKSDIVDSESSSRTASAGVDGSAVGDGRVCGIGAVGEENDDDGDKVDGQDLESAIDLDSVAGALREVRLGG